MAGCDLGVLRPALATDGHGQRTTRVRWLYPRASWLIDHLARIFAVSGMALPEFWIGLLLLLDADV